MMSIRSVVLAIVAAIAIATPGHAAEWPTRLVRFVVPFTAGGATDVLTRLLCQRLSTELNVPFIVENRGGAGGNVGGAAVAGAPNDGYTFLMGAPGVLSYNKALYREMRFDPDRELEPVSLFARLPNVLVVNPEVPARNVAELVAYAKANPNKLNYGAIGAGATSFLSAELFKSMAGVDIQFVSYSATTLSLTELITGRIQLVIDNLISFLPVIRDRRVRALGMSTAVRSPPHRGSWLPRLQARRRTSRNHLLLPSGGSPMRRIFVRALQNWARSPWPAHRRRQRLSWRKKPPSGSGSSPRPGVRVD
jgi:tripartite-type tricarboxylate transporter receptor subunit TctC